MFWGFFLVKGMILSADLMALQHGKDPQNLDSPSSKQPLAQYLIMFPAVNLKGRGSTDTNFMIY